MVRPRGRRRNITGCGVLSSPTVLQLNRLLLSKTVKGLLDCIIQLLQARRSRRRQSSCLEDIQIRTLQHETRPQTPKASSLGLRPVFRDEEHFQLWRAAMWSYRLTDLTTLVIGPRLHLFWTRREQLPPLVLFTYPSRQANHPILHESTTACGQM